MSSTSRAQRGDVPTRRLLPVRGSAAPPPRVGRLAAENGVDATDYTRSYTAHSFVPYYSQSICSACVMHGADGILKGIRKASHSRLRAAVGRA